ncbi:MAG TPA: alpha/beta hydrolase [Stellaceae bacterium]|nr:alpha/beta hydrolase [Stellaceae bacterium]
MSYQIRIEEMPYSRHPSGDLLARLYLPQGPGPFPGVVEVHGGAWILNDRLTNRDIHQPLAASGVVVMAIDFRMPPAAQYPASIADINLAMRWLKRHARDFNLDPARVGGLGTSSGGHQLMLAALRPDDPRFNALPLAGGEAIDPRPAFVVLCWSILDPLARYRMAVAKGIDRLVKAHQAYWPSEAAMSEGNPQLIVEHGQAQHRPPVLLLQGTNDDNVTPDMAERFLTAYRAKGGAIELETFPGEPHAFIAKDPASAASRRAIERIIAYVHDR